MKKTSFFARICSLLFIAGFLPAIIAAPALAAEILTIDPVPEQVSAGDSIEFKGFSSLPAGSKLKWSFGTEGYVTEEYFHYHEKDKFRYYDESDTTTKSTGGDYSEWRVRVGTQNLNPGYYDFQIAGEEAFAERIIVIDNEQNIVKDVDLSQILPDIDLYVSPNSKFIIEDTSGRLNLIPERYRRNLHENFASDHITSAENLVSGNELEIDMFTMPGRIIGLWFYSAFPENSYRYFTCISSDETTGEAKIYFDTGVTASLKPGEYYIFVEAAGRNFQEAYNLRPDADNLVSLPVLPEPDRKSIESPASSTALDAALKSYEDEIKYLRFKISVEEPWINIDRIDDVSLGEKFWISGKTNFEDGTVLDIEIIPVSDLPATEVVARTTEAEVATSTEGERNWRTSVNSYLLGTGEYIIRVSDRDHKLTEDNAVIEIIDEAYGAENTDADSLVVRSYSVDPVSKEVVYLNEPSHESPLSAGIILAAITGIIGMAGMRGRE